MRIGIIDDELHCIKSLILDIKHSYPDCDIVFYTTKALEGLALLKEHSIDLLFLDVEMPGLNGIELLQKLGDISLDVIFTTAYSQYAVQAFKAQATNYLLKPIDACELKEAIDHWKEKKSKQENNEEIENLLEQLKKEGILTSKIAIPVADGIEFIEVGQIIYCQSESNYVYIHLINGKQILISKTLKEVEATLNSFFFFRPSQSYLINPNYMKKYVKNDGGYIIMDNGLQIPVSNSKKELILSVFKAVERKSN